MVAAALRIPDQAAPVVYKNNSDGKGNSYGCHENYMMDRAVPFAKVIDGVVPHFVSRTLFTGSGKVGVETPALDAETVRVPDFPAGRVLRGDRRARDDAEAPDRQHPGRAPRRPQALPAAARDRRGRQPVGDRDLPEGGHDRDRAVDGRGRRRPDPRPVAGGPGAGAAPGVGRPDAGPSAGADRRDDGHRARDPVGALRRRPQVRRGVRPDVAGRRRRRSAHWSWSTGRRSSRGSSRTRPRLADTLDWVAKRELLAGLPGAARRAAGRTPGWPPWPCSITTCGRTSRCTGAWACALVDPAEVVDGGHRAAPGDPGLVPGQVPGPLARGRGDRQLGFSGLRHRDRPVAARPYDGPPEGNSRAHGRAAGQSTGPADLLDRLNS